ncbi:adenine deaminase [Hydrogenimonas sp.]
MILKANYVDIENRTVRPASIEVAEGKIVAVKPTDEMCSTYVLPGFVDAHIHIESSMLPPSEFARLAVRHGTVATVSDPHEIANVLGIEGVEYMLSDAKRSPLKFHFGASPCVPATPFETSGAVLGVREVEKLLERPGINHLSEVMNFPAVVEGDPEILAKIDAAKRAGVPIDGHAPGLRGEALQRYIDAGITTDHEAGDYEEALEKLERGMKIIIREGSAAKNFDALAPLIGTYHDRLMFCSDDRHPDDLLEGHIDTLVARAVALGHDLFHVLKIACLNPVEHYRLDVGRLRPGESADFIEVENLESFEVIRTVIGGEEVYHREKGGPPSLGTTPVNRFQAIPVEAEAFRFEASCNRIRVIEATDHELSTGESFHAIPSGRRFEADTTRDILKIAVLNRYEAKRRAAVGFVRGFGLKRGAIASSVAHDSHNIIVVGCSDDAMAKAVDRIVASKGGLSAVNGEETIHLPLKIAGLMSDADAFEVARNYATIDRYAKERLGSPLDAPFMTLSFMALLVIPELKLGDRGLFDGRKFRFVPVCVAEEER